MMGDEDRELLSVPSQIVRRAEWILIIYQGDGDKLPTFKLIHSPHFFQRRTMFRDASRHVRAENL
jgi:hypothetical protein